MKKIIGIVILGLIVLFLALGIIRKGETEEVQSITKIQQTQGIPVLAYTVHRRDVNETKRYFGTVRAANQVVVSSKLMERIDQILVNVGDFVKEGQPVVTFDTTASQVQVTAARLAFENAKLELARMQALYDAGAISKQMLDQVKLQHDIAEESFQTAHRTVQLLAPISGTVTRKDFEDGAIANPGDVILTIVGKDRYEVVFDVTQEDRTRLRKGQPVNVTFDHLKITSGKVSHVSLATVQDSRMFTVYADLTDGQGLYPGSLATVDVTLEERKNVLAAPIEGLIKRGNLDVVVLIHDDMAKIQPVQVGLRGEEMVEIRQGVEEGDVVAVYGHTGLEDGMKVKIIEE